MTYSTPRWIFEKVRMGDFNEDGRADVLIRSINTEGPTKGARSFCSYESVEIARECAGEI